MAKTRQVQWEQKKLQQMMMESDMDDEAAANNLGTPRSFVGTPRSFTTRSTRSQASDSPVPLTYSPAIMPGGNPKVIPLPTFSLIACITALFDIPLGATSGQESQMMAVRRITLPY